MPDLVTLQIAEVQITVTHFCSMKAKYLDDMDETLEGKQHKNFAFAYIM